ncbi:putative Sulphate transporter [Modestobacter italicus]|uniref:Sulphate transporter n=1 Tax=Modestobacter italicus (strain DSM 44449 / CECT 9708 / BC 501) TaxID=2732864 RepID=I4EUA9_MODI5|nr:SulP family inorganic anion transporter [Modestobacter marinus]CCH86972.1 putative Sulphate transporter [Modestobacter marinus]
MDRRGLGKDAVSGMVLGVESVPDGLASGLLAGVNPLAGLYGYLYGMVGAAFLTGTTFMAVQATGAMALVVADVDLASYQDPARALFTLAVLTGFVMILAGVLRAGTLLRFVPTAVMTGFVTAVGLNILLGQLANFTGFESDAGNRVLRALDLVLHPWGVDVWVLTVGVVTTAAIVLLQRTPLRSLGLVVAIVLGSLLAAGLDRWGHDVPLVSDLADIPNSLPGPVLPDLSDTASLSLAAVSLAFVGLVQGAAISAGIPNPDGARGDPNRDFVGQGAGNLAAGLFQGMPVGGSMSASALLVASGAHSRLALVVAAGVMAVTVLLFADVVGLVAMPALAALLIVVAVGTIKPAAVLSVWRTGPVQAALMGVTLVLTLLVPLQYAVLVGVGLAIVAFVAQQSNRLTVRRLVPSPDGRMRECDAPRTLPAGTVTVLQPYGSLFFASAPVFRAQLPRVDDSSAPAVVVLRFRGVDQFALSIIDVLRGYAGELSAVGSRLVLVVSSDRAVRQLEDVGLAAQLGTHGVYRGWEWLGEAVRRAYQDSQQWIEHGRGDGAG